eukprot:TRINITY_DN20755_c0_g1_i1.p1 TRINITY_DN20755_c0_g1~~TRINITY_DN20755_c0_g1_i1.p1  ORF type:complete len:1388 (+),score=466.82 TRINITY_DN20755_c0_g1_i1:105-4166(+)
MGAMMVPVRYAVTGAGTMAGLLAAPILAVPALIIAVAFFPTNILLSFWWALVTCNFGWRVRILIIPFVWVPAVGLFACELLVLPMVFLSLGTVQGIIQPPLREGVYFLGIEALRIGTGMVRSTWRNHMELASYLARKRHGAHCDLPHVGHVPVVAITMFLGAAANALVACPILLLKLLLAPLFALQRLGVLVGGAALAAAAAGLAYGAKSGPPADVLAAKLMVPAACVLAPFLIICGGYGIISPLRSLHLYERWQVAMRLNVSFLLGFDQETTNWLFVPRLLRLPQGCCQLPRRPHTHPQPVATNIAESFYRGREDARDLPGSPAPLGDARAAWDLLDAVLWAYLDEATIEGMLPVELVHRFPLDGPNPFNPVARAVASLAVADAALRAASGGFFPGCPGSPMLQMPDSPQGRRPWIILCRTEGGVDRLRSVYPELRHHKQGMAQTVFRAAERAAGAVRRAEVATHAELVWLRWWLCGWHHNAGWYHENEPAMLVRLQAAGWEPIPEHRQAALRGAGRLLLTEVEYSRALPARGAWWSGPAAKTARRQRDEALQLQSAKMAPLRGVPAVVGDLSRDAPRVLLAAAPFPVAPPSGTLASPASSAATPSGRRRRLSPVRPDEPRVLTQHAAEWAQDQRGVFKFMYSYQPSNPSRACSAKLLIDAAEFMREARRMFNGAKHEIMISSWKFSPWFGMKRADDKVPDWRALKRLEHSRGADTQDKEHRVEIMQGETLRQLLMRKAREGVCVYVLLFQSHRRIMGAHFSDEAAADLWAASEELSREGAKGSIQVLRHPPPTAAASAGLADPLSADNGAAPRFAFSHHQKFCCVDRNEAIVGGLDFCIGRFDTPEHLLSDPCRKLWPGQDFYNPACGVAPVFGADLWLGHQWHDSRRELRLPWHDTTILVDGECANDVCNVFVSRWNHHMEEDGCSDPVSAIMPASWEPLAPTGSSQQRAQVLLSLAPWCGSAHVEMSVYGAHVAAISSAKYHIYLEQQYVASSCTSDPPENHPSNLVFAALITRLREALQLGEERDPLRVVLTLTLPEESDDTAQGIIKWLLHSVSRGPLSLMEQLRRDGFKQAEIARRLSVVWCRSHAILPPWPDGRDPPLGPEPHPVPVLPTDGPYSWRERDNALRSGHYIAVHGMVFVHSKLLIVDDKIMICGSANLNDRSLLGRRDSELCIMCSDDDQVEIEMAGRKVLTGRLPHESRVRLMEEHSGVLWNSDAREYRHGQRRSQFADPLSPETIRFWDSQADSNAIIYKRVFPGGPPSDQVRVVSQFIAHPWRKVNDQVAFPPEELQSLQELGVDMPPTATVREALSRVHGHLYRHPVGFLDDDDLTPPFIEAVSRVNGFDIVQ